MQWSLVFRIPVSVETSLTLEKALHYWVVTVGGLEAGRVKP